MKCKYRAFLLSACLGLASSALAWKQNEFIVATYSGPMPTNNAATDSLALRKFVEANFNMFITWPGVTYWAGNSYILDRVAGINQAYGGTVLRTMVRESSPTANMSNYTALTGAKANALYGYFVADEPWIGAPLEAAMDSLAVVHNADTSRPAMINSAVVWSAHLRFNESFASIWSRYADSVMGRVARSPHTPLMSVSYYPIMDYYHDGSLEYHTGISDSSPFAVSYFAHMKLFAEKAAQHGKIFWGLPLSTGHSLQWYNNTPNLVKQHTYPTPTVPLLRYGANATLIHGAKGILWFLYSVQTGGCAPGDIAAGLIDYCENYRTTPESDPDVYDAIQQVNLELKNMGPTLMRMRWLTTVHGASTDPDSDEPNLPVLNWNTPLILSGSTIDDRAAIGIFADTGDLKTHYLTVMNKDLSASRYSAHLQFHGCRKLEVMDKSTGDFELLTYSCENNVASVYVPILDPGEMHLLRISAVGNPAARIDYDGDGISDLSTKGDEGYGRFYADLSSDGFTGLNIEMETSYIGNGPYMFAAPADYDGDGLTDFGRKSEYSWAINYARAGLENHEWYEYSMDGASRGWGDTLCVPAPADYDGDGKADLSIYCRGDLRKWYIDYSSNGFNGVEDSVYRVHFAANTIPVPADYNGDGKADIAIYSLGGEWRVDYAPTWSGWDVAVEWDVNAYPVPADYDNDGAADFATYSPNAYSGSTLSGRWSYHHSSTGYSYSRLGWPGPHFRPAPGDYDGDGLVDLAVKNDSTGVWHIDFAANGYGSTDVTYSGWGDENYHALSKPVAPEAQVLSRGGEISLVFSLPRASRVKVVAFSLEGKKLSQLFNESMKEGSNTVSWSKSYLSDKGLKRGVYILSLQADGYRVTKRITLTD